SIFILLNLLVDRIGVYRFNRRFFLKLFEETQTNYQNANWNQSEIKCGLPIIFIKNKAGN
ncbi:MAG: hypothetical protein ACRDE8_04135, partial [Ginsengibacter sp.]